MNKVCIVLLTLILTMAVGLGGCITINPPAALEPEPSPAPTPAPRPTTSPIAAPELVSPHNRATGIKLTPTLLWREVANAKGYDVTISLNYDFSDIVHGVSTQLTAYQIREALEPSTRYYWMVAAGVNPADPNTPVAYSAIWMFTTAPGPIPSLPPEYKTVSFTVEANGDHMFSIFVRNEQTLHLFWLVKEGPRVWFHFLTPSGRNFGFYQNGQYANGTLSEDVCQGFSEGITQFSPSEYGWGEGYYQVLVTSAMTSPSRVEVQYWIED